MLFSNRLEVWNPGSLPPSLTLDKLRKPHSSVPANPLLAESLYLAKYIERMGTGTRDMIQDCINAGLAEPDFSLTDGFVATVYRKPGRAFEAVGGKQQAESPTKSRAESGVESVMQVLIDIPLSMAEISEKVGRRQVTGALQRLVQNLLSKKFVERTIPAKPNSCLQKYRLTKKGAGYLKKRGKK